VEDRVDVLQSGVEGLAVVEGEGPGRQIEPLAQRLDLRAVPTRQDRALAGRCGAFGDELAGVPIGPVDKQAVHRRAC